MESELLTIVLVDEHRLFIDALASGLAKTPGIQVLAMATDGEDGLTSLLETEPDVAIMDVELPGRGPFDIITELKRKKLRTRFLLLAGHLSDILLERALQLEVSGYLLKSEPFETLVSAIQQVATGESCYSRAVEERIRQESCPSERPPHFRSCLSSLTNRQLEVLRHLANGRSIKEIARTMHLSAKSVDSHRYRIARKLGIHNRVALARYAVREGLVSP